MRSGFSHALHYHPGVLPERDGIKNIEIDLLIY